MEEEREAAQRWVMHRRWLLLRMYVQSTAPPHVQHRVAISDWEDLAIVDWVGMKYAVGKRLNMTDELTDAKIDGVMSRQNRRLRRNGFRPRRSFRIVHGLRMFPSSFCSSHLLPPPHLLT